jgi:hypothetical protein
MAKPADGTRNFIFLQFSGTRLRPGQSGVDRVVGGSGLVGKSAAVRVGGGCVCLPSPEPRRPPPDRVRFAFLFFGNFFREPHRRGARARCDGLNRKSSNALNSGDIPIGFGSQHPTETQKRYQFKKRPCFRDDSEKQQRCDRCHRINR